MSKEKVVSKRQELRGGGGAPTKMTITLDPSASPYYQRQKLTLTAAPDVSGNLQPAKYGDDVHFELSAGLRLYPGASVDQTNDGSTPSWDLATYVDVSGETVSYGADTRNLHGDPPPDPLPSDPGQLNPDPKLTQVSPSLPVSKVLQAVSTNNGPGGTNQLDVSFDYQDDSGSVLTGIAMVASVGFDDAIEDFDFYQWDYANTNWGSKASLDPNFPKNNLAVIDSDGRPSKNATVKFTVVPNSNSAGKYLWRHLYARVGSDKIPLANILLVDTTQEPNDWLPEINIYGSTGIIDLSKFGSFGCVIDNSTASKGYELRDQDVVFSVVNGIMGNTAYKYSENNPTIFNLVSTDNRLHTTPDGKENKLGYVVYRPTDEAWGPYVSGHLVFFAKGTAGNPGPPNPPTADYGTPSIFEQGNAPVLLGGMILGGMHVVVPWNADGAHWQPQPDDEVIMTFYLSGWDDLGNKRPDAQPEFAHTFSSDDISNHQSDGYMKIPVDPTAFGGYARNYKGHGEDSTLQLQLTIKPNAGGGPFYSNVLTTRLRTLTIGET